MSIELILIIVVLGFILEFFDASLGQGYGLLTPVLLLLGFEVLEVVFSVILTSALNNTVAGFFHQRFKNIDLRLRGSDIRILTLLAGFGLLGVIIGVFAVFNIPENLLKSYIGLLIIVIGILVLINYKIKSKFSWKKLITFGAIAGFDKGISGAAYGPVLTSGQILSGIDSKNAVGITTVAECIIAAFGVFLFFVMNPNLIFFNPSLIVALFAGALIAAPLGAYTTKRMPSDKLKIMIAIANVLLGSLLLIETIL